MQVLKLKNMKLKSLLLIILGVTITLTSCKKKDPEVPNTPVGSQPGASASQLINFFAGNNTAAKQNFTITASSPALITGNKGTTLQFYANSFENGSGSSITGNVDIELIEIYGKKDMLFLNKQTLGDNNGILSPLISGGEFKVTASQGGNEVYLKQGYSYTAKVPTSTVDPNMEVFYQNSISDDTLTWSQNDTAEIWGDTINNPQYNVNFGSLGWVNCDYFMNQQNQTSVSVDVPDGFSGTNCGVFVSFDGYNSLTSIYNYSNGVFNTGTYYTIPQGLAVHFIVLAFINNVPHTAIVPATITANHIEIISALTATTLAQLAIDIQNLP